MQHFNHADSCNCKPCVRDRAGALQKIAATEARVRRSRSTKARRETVARREDFNGRAARWDGAPLRTSLGAALDKAGLL